MVLNVNLAFQLCQNVQYSQIYDQKNTCSLYYCTAHIKTKYLPASQGSQTDEKIFYLIIQKCSTHWYTSV